MRYFFLTLLIVLLLLSIRRIIKPTYSFFKRREEFDWGSIEGGSDEEKLASISKLIDREAAREEYQKKGDLPNRRYFDYQKPEKCPNCGFSPVALLHWGRPSGTPEHRRAALEGEIINAGSSVNKMGIPFTDLPNWRCSVCDQDIWSRNPLIKITCKNTISEYLDNLDIDHKLGEKEVYLYLDQGEVLEDTFRSEGGDTNSDEHAVIEDIEYFFDEYGHIGVDLKYTKSDLIKKISEDIIEEWHWNANSDKVEYIKNLNWDLIWNTVQKSFNKNEILTLYGIKSDDVLSLEIT